MKVLDAKAAVVKECGRLEKLLAWRMTRVRSNKDVLKEAEKEARTVHVATLMDTCNLLNSEFEPKFHKYKGRVVVRSDIVKDHSDL